MFAAKEGKEEDVRTYLSTGDRNSQDWQKKLDQSVVIAIKEKQPRIMKLLVEAGANLDQSVENEKYKNKKFPLLFEALRSADPDILDTFLENYKGDIASQLQCMSEPYYCYSFLVEIIYRQRLDFVKQAFTLLKENNITLNERGIHYALLDALRLSQSDNSNDVDPDKTSSGCAILECLLEQGLKLNSTDELDRTPLHMAILQGKIEAAKCLIKHGADVMARNMIGHTPLHLAAIFGNMEVAQCLIIGGADVMARDKENRTPLYFAAMHERKKDVVQCLIKHGADVMAVANDGSCPWMFACQRKSDIMAELLNGVDLKRKLSNGRSSLHQTCICGYIDSTKYLLENGADVNSTDEDSLTPLFVMCLHQHAHQDDPVYLKFDPEQDEREVNYRYFRVEEMAKEMIKNRQLMQILTESGADVNHRDTNGHTLLMKREMYGDKYKREFLIQHGADLNVVGQDGLTVLWTGIEYDCETELYLINDLLARNLNIGLNQYKYEGMTPLQLAYSKGNRVLCDILLDAGCSLHDMLEFMDANINLESGENMQGFRSRIVELSSRPYSLQELSRQAVLRGMGSGNLVEKVTCMKEDEMLPISLLNFLLRNLSKDPWFD